MLKPGCIDQEAKIVLRKLINAAMADPKTSPEDKRILQHINKDLDKFMICPGKLWTDPATEGLGEHGLMRFGREEPR